MELNFNKQNNPEPERESANKYPQFMVLGAEEIEPDLYKVVGHLMEDHSKVVTLIMESTIKVPWGGQFTIKDGGMYHTIFDFSDCYKYDNGDIYPKNLWIGAPVKLIKDK